MPNERASYGELRDHAEGSRKKSNDKKTRKSPLKTGAAIVAGGLAATALAAGLNSEIDHAMEVQDRFYEPPKKVAPAAPGETSQQRAERAMKDAQKAAIIRRELAGGNSTELNTPTKQVTDITKPSVETVSTVDSEKISFSVEQIRLQSFVAIATVEEGDTPETIYQRSGWNDGTTTFENFWEATKLENKNNPEMPDINNTQAGDGIFIDFKNNGQEVSTK